MNCNDEYIVKLCKASIFDKAPEKPKAALDWNYIYSKSVEQNIAGLLFAAISKLDTEFQPNKELMAKWNAAMLSTIGVMSSRYNEFLRINKLMQDNGITFIGLKGCVVRNLYPVPELRTMGDFDVLIDKKNISKATIVFKNNNYKTEKDLFGIVADNHKAHWEVFYSLEEEFKINYKELTCKFLGNIIENDDVFMPEYTSFLAHMIIHTARHFFETGAGIRNICDIALFIKKYKKSIDFAYLEDICCEQNYKKIYCYILNTLKQWFYIDLSGIEYEQKDCNKFVEYMLLYGIFGKQNNVLLRQVSLDRNPDSQGIVRLFFPSAKVLENRYKYLKRAPFLLPIAWIQRILYGKFGKHVKIRHMFRDINEALDFSNQRMEWLTEMELEDKK